MMTLEMQNATETFIYIGFRYLKFKLDCKSIEYSVKENFYVDFSYIRSYT